MNMGHLRHGNQYIQDFIGMEEILETIGARYEFTRTDAPYDSTAVRYEIPDSGNFGIIANETEPFCSSCTRLRLSSNGFIYGCLSNASSHDIKPILDLPRHHATARLQGLLVNALADKQDLSFKGEVTVMKFIGG
jgi:cyclic pyranopterin phosphate synthase